MNSNALLVEQVWPVPVLPPVSAPSGVSAQRVSMKNYSRATVIVSVRNASTVTGSAISLRQTQNVANSPDVAKTLAFAKAYRNLDAAAGDAMAEFAVSNDTFTTDGTNSKNLLYAIEVKAEDMDVDNGFDVLEVMVGNASNAVVGVMVLLWPARYGKLAQPSAIVD